MTGPAPAGAAPAGDAHVEVADAPDEQRYEARIDGELAAFAEYRLRPGRIVFTHTETAPAFRGHGVADALVRSALDDVRRRGLAVKALCPYVAGWLDRHPGYSDLVSGG